MAVNVASKYHAQVDEHILNTALTTPGVNNDYDMGGARSILIYNIQTVAMRDYTRSGVNRYGTPQELGDTMMEYSMELDRAFAFIIDMGNYVDQMWAKKAGIALKKQINEQVLPELDTHRLMKMVEGAGKIFSQTATPDNAYELFLNAQSTLGNAKTPLNGRVVFVSYKYYAQLKLNPSFVGMGDLAQTTRFTGQLGMVDGVPVIPVPESYLPEKTQFILTHPSATVAPQKLAEYKIHTNPPGINGALVEGRIYYDAFVLENKKDRVYVSRAA